MTSGLPRRRFGIAPAVFIAGSRFSATNRRLRDALTGIGVQALVCSPDGAAATAIPGDVIVGRLDVRRTLDGVEPGLGHLRLLQRCGIRVVNDADALVAAHDKLASALLLHAASVPQPRTLYTADDDPSPGFEPPYVVKPRFGSWGRDVHRCESRRELRWCIRELSRRRWFARHGALVQELISPRGFDLRLVVAAGEVIGAVVREASPGEWRTNIALGGRRRSATPPPDAAALAVRAAAAIGGGLVGVDLLPEDGGWRVIEINGAVDFTDEYALDGRDVFLRAIEPFAPSAPLALAGGGHP
jgi:[lysine-biosynthesis-protein LysW]--L-2-aminoadipate ligase